MPFLGALLWVACFAVVLALSRKLLRLADERRWPIAFALATLLMYALPALVGRLTHHLISAVLVSAALSALGWWLLRRHAPDPPRSSEPPARPYWFAWLVAGIGFVLVSWATLEHNFWDEDSGHWPLTNVLARGGIPPEHPLFPGAPFRYHYAIDLLAAQIQAFTDVSTVRAIDVVTIGTYLLLLGTAASIGGALAGRRGASLAMILAPLGTGTIAFLLWGGEYGLKLDWDEIPAAWTIDFPPPVISYFFQHPMGLGMPMALACGALLVGSDAVPTAAPRPRAELRRVLAVALLGGLSLANMAFFTVVGAAQAIWVLWRFARTRDARSAALDLFSLAMALGLARLLGGFLEGGSGITSQLVVGRGYLDEPAPTWLLHHLALFGLPLVAVPLAALRAHEEPRHLRFFLIVGASIGFGIPVLASYSLSYDIMKFYAVGSFFGSVLLADLLAAVAARRQLLGHGAVVLLVAAATLSGWLWLARMSVLNGHHGLPALGNPPPKRISLAVAERLGPLVGPFDRVLATDSDLASSVGFLIPGFDWRAGQGRLYLIDRTRADRFTRHLQAARRDLARRDLEALGVRWAVLGPADVARLSAAGRAALADSRRFEHLFDVRVEPEVRHVYRIR